MARATGAGSSSREATDRFVYAFAEGGREDRDVLGGKGAGLAEMASLGLPVAPGFVIGCPAEREYRRQGEEMPEGLMGEVEDHLRELEQASGRGFGEPERPLLVSVRSGAPVSMPGMMDTILNVGLNEETAEALAEDTGDRDFALGCYVLLLESWARVVRGISGGLVEEALMDVDEARSDDLLLARVEALLRLIEEESGRPFPGRPRDQLAEAIETVFGSWESPRAKAYRDHKGIDHDTGTAVVVQAMVFGNLGRRSGSGVAFSRDPSTGEKGVYGDFLFESQGEEVVSGERDPQSLAALEADLPEVFSELERVVETLERHEHDMCEVEFTVEEGSLWILQTRVAQRSARAAVRLVVDLADEGLIDVREAINRVTDEQIEAARAARFAREPSAEELLARGVAASPGAAIGGAVFDSSRAQQLAGEGDVILVRPTTSPADVQGMIAACGVVTGRGGRTSHAAVVARGLHRPAVCSAGALEVKSDMRGAILGDATIRESDTLSVDGDRGTVARGALPLASAEADEHLVRLLKWKSGDTGG